MKKRIIVCCLSAIMLWNLFIPAYAEGKQYLNTKSGWMRMPDIELEENASEEQIDYFFSNSEETRGLSGYTDIDGEYFDKAEVYESAWKVIQSQARIGYEKSYDLEPQAEREIEEEDLNNFIFHGLIGYNNFPKDNEDGTVNEIPEDGYVEGDQSIWFDPKLFFEVTDTYEEDDLAEYYYPYISEVNAGVELKPENFIVSLNGTSLCSSPEEDFDWEYQGEEDHDLIVTEIEPSKIDKGVNEITVIATAKWGTEYKIICPVIGFPQKMPEATEEDKVTNSNDDNDHEKDEMTHAEINVMNETTAIDAKTIAMMGVALSGVCIIGLIILVIVLIKKKQNFK